MSNLKNNLDKLYKQHILEVLKDEIENETDDKLVEGMKHAYKLIDTKIFKGEDSNG